MVKTDSLEDVPLRHVFRFATTAPGIALSPVCDSVAYLVWNKMPLSQRKQRGNKSEYLSLSRQWSCFFYQSVGCHFYPLEGLKYWQSSPALPQVTIIVFYMHMIHCN